MFRKWLVIFVVGFLASTAAQVFLTTRQASVIVICCLIGMPIFVFGYGYLQSRRAR